MSDYAGKVRFEHVPGYEARGVKSEYHECDPYQVDAMPEPTIVRTYNEIAYKRIDAGIDANARETYIAWRNEFIRFMREDHATYHVCPCGRLTLCQPIFLIKRARGASLRHNRPRPVICEVKCGCDIVKVRINPDSDEWERWSYHRFCSRGCELDMYTRTLNTIIMDELREVADPANEEINI